MEIYSECTSYKKKQRVKLVFAEETEGLSLTTYSGSTLLIAFKDNRYEQAIVQLYKGIAWK